MIPLRRTHLEPQAHVPAIDLAVPQGLSTATFGNG
jgi:hypothetical protein